MVTRTRQATVRLGRDLLHRYQATRSLTEHLVQPLEPEDCVVQSMPDVSPTRWHLAHATWFFETFVLARHGRDHRVFDPAYADLFNSYYRTINEPFPRARRGLLTRPTVSEVMAYRRHVDARMADLLEGCDDPDIAGLVELGLNHEQQHQELILTDIKHVLAQNPLQPVYRADAAALRPAVAPHRTEWVLFRGGVHHVGHDGNGFAFDNEGPQHAVLLREFELASRLVTNGEFRAFVEDGGYRRPELWLDEGWSWIRENGITAPLYWQQRDGVWREFTLRGPMELADDLPACHLGYHEADAFARWAGARLPTEFEWEVAAASARAEIAGGNTLDSDRLHPAVAPAERTERAPSQMIGDVWEWTASPYSAYPGYRPLAGSLGEYNGKFMCSQIVLRGGSCLSAASHLRATYRNFFYPTARWQCSGLRLAR